MPSPTSTTVPTLRVSVVASNWSIGDLMMLMISSERMAMGSPVVSGASARAGAGAELVAQPLEAAADGVVEEAVADLDRQSADDRWVDLGAEVDGGAGHRLDRVRGSPWSRPR